MRIDPSHAQLNPPSSATVGRAQGGAGSSDAGTSSIVLSDTLLGLSAALQQLPEVRPDVLAAVTDRYARGELLTPAALQETVAAMMDRS